MPNFILAHGVEAHETAVAESSSLYDTLTHQSAPLSLLLIAFVLFVLFTVMRFLNVNFLNRVLVLVPVIIGIAIFYLPHNAAVTTVVLSCGFILTFLLVFTMLAAKPE